MSNSSNLGSAKISSASSISQSSLSSSVSASAWTPGQDCPPCIPNTNPRVLIATIAGFDACGNYFVDGTYACEQISPCIWKYEDELVTIEIVWMYPYYVGPDITVQTHSGGTDIIAIFIDDTPITEQVDCKVFLVKGYALAYSYPECDCSCSVIGYGQ